LSPSAVRFTGRITLSVRPSHHKLSPDELHEIAEKVRHDFPGLTAHHLSVTTHDRSLTFHCTGECDGDEHAERAVQQYGRLINERFTRYFQSYRCSGWAENVKEPEQVSV
jgi:hypothetical protein